MLLDTDPDSQYGSRPEPGQCFGPELDPHSMRSEDPNPDLESRYGSGKGKSDPQKKKCEEISWFEVQNVLPGWLEVSPID